MLSWYSFRLVSWSSRVPFISIDILPISCQHAHRIYYFAYPPKVNCSILINETNHIASIQIVRASQKHRNVCSKMFSWLMSEFWVCVLLCLPANRSYLLVVPRKYKWVSRININSNKLINQQSTESHLMWSENFHIWAEMNHINTTLGFWCDCVPLSWPLYDYRLHWPE